jgi:hypothetical protein
VNAIKGGKISLTPRRRDTIASIDHESAPIPHMKPALWFRPNARLESPLPREPLARVGSANDSESMVAFLALPATGYRKSQCFNSLTH